MTRIRKPVEVDDGLGGVHRSWVDVPIPKTSDVWLDLLSGSDRNSDQNAMAENSTHILIIQPYMSGIDSGMQVVSDDAKVYSITYPDNPVGANHHNELYLEYLNGVDADE